VCVSTLITPTDTTRYLVR